jgi:mannose-6-phosphate isomerase
MTQASLYPLKFDPIYQYRIWGGRRLENLLNKALPPDDPIGEAWVLSDRDDHPSVVAEGPLKGQTIKQIMEVSADELLGRYAVNYRRFPLLLKFLDAQQVLSVQVHPADDMKEYIPEGESGKTEAWVVLETGPKGLIYAGLKPGTTRESLQKDLDAHKVVDDLASFAPKPGDAVLIKAGTVHTLADLVVFEVQENSDVTYRLYDWDRVDEKTGKPRDLQVKEALACIDLAQTSIGPVAPAKNDEETLLKEKLLDSDHFLVWRLTCKSICTIGEEGEPSILVGINGDSEIQTHSNTYTLSKGEVMLLPASVGPCKLIAKNGSVILEVHLPDMNAATVK